MTVESQIVRLATQKEGEIQDVTNKVQTIIENGTIKNGVAFLFVPGSTAALTTIEYEPGLLADLPSMIERIAPRDGSYEYERRWHDGNGHSHIRSFADRAGSIRAFRREEVDAGNLAADRLYRI
jgi:secondary thiamine-phosphate synthase enzyme